MVEIDPSFIIAVFTILVLGLLRLCRGKKKTRDAHFIPNPASQESDAPRI